MTSLLWKLAACLSLLKPSSSRRNVPTFHRNPFASPATPRGGAESTRSDKNIEMEEQESSDPWIPLGGGAVNEKSRHFDEPSDHAVDGVGFQPEHHRSHLYHALEGLDRYPNYLQRWSTSDMTRLETALERQLTRVRQQRLRVTDVRAAIHELVEEWMVQSASSKDTEPNWSDLWLYSQPKDWKDVRRILDSRAAMAIFGSTMFQTTNSTPVTLESVLSGAATVNLDVAKLTQLMDEACYDVYSFPLLSKDFCQRLRDYLQSLATLARSSNDERLHQLGRRPFDLDAIGLAWLNDLLFHLIIRPISRHLFQSTEHLAELDWRHGFVAGYSATPQVGTPRERLVPHTDDSEITLNVGLGNVFEGGEVVFHGLRGSDEQPAEVFGSIPPRPGVALLHVGRHLHAVTQVTSGDRYALIVWARSWQGIRSRDCPCCWLNRRQDSSCICGSKWN